MHGQRAGRARAFEHVRSFAELRSARRAAFRRRGETTRGAAHLSRLPPPAWRPQRTRRNPARTRPWNRAARAGGRDVPARHIDGAWTLPRHGRRERSGVHVHAGRCACHSTLRWGRSATCLSADLSPSSLRCSLWMVRRGDGEATRLLSHEGIHMTTPRAPWARKRRDSFLRSWLARLPPARRSGIAGAIRIARFDPPGLLIEFCAHDHRVSPGELVSLLPEVADESKAACAAIRRDSTTASSLQPRAARPTVA